MFDFSSAFARTKDLGQLSDIMSPDSVAFKKIWGKLLNQSRRDAKGDKCHYCGEPCSGFCNSHSVPAFCLRNIAVNGDVYFSNVLVNLPIIDYEKGVNNSGTFHIICRDCDSTIFKDYESVENYHKEPSAKMLGQIAMKNYLKGISKRELEIAMYNIMQTDFPSYSEVIDQRQLINRLDLEEYEMGFKRAKSIARKGWNDEYYLFCYEKLDYVVPMAFQGSITLLNDFEGNVINDIYNDSPDYHTKDIHISVFPFEEFSVVMMFIDSKDKRYRNFCKQFRKLSLEDRLAAVNYMIFSYSEDVFLYKGIEPTALQDPKLIMASRKTTEIESMIPVIDPYSVATGQYDFSDMKDMPNLLLEKYKTK